MRRHEVVHSILGVHKRTQRWKVDGLNHHLRPIAEEANRQSIPFTQSKYRRVGEGPEDMRNP